MFCERCGKREATVNVVCVVNDTRVSKWLCESCAREFAAEGVLAGQKGEGARNILEEIFKPLRRLAENNYYEDAAGQKDHFYTELGERVLAAARRTANQRQQEEIGTEHILWAMLQEPDSQAAHLLLRCGVDKYTLLGELETWMGKTAEGANPVTYTKNASTALHYAKSFSDADGLYLIGSGHILLGLLATEGCVASRVLARFNIDMNRVQVMMHEEFIQTHSLPEKNKFKSQAKKEKAEAEMKKALKLLKGFGRNLNELAAQDKLDPMLGRERELEHVMRILCRRTKNNPVLIGESGVGKTAIAEGLAQRIANQEVPEFLRDKIIFSLELGYVVAGAKYRGELEERLRNIIEAVKHCPRIILFMDELQMLMNGGDGTMNIANIIKPALARGELHVIGATTLEDYRKSVEKDAALERRFQPVRIDAPDTETALKILSRLCGRYERYHHVHVTEEALEAAVKLSDRYLTDRNLPDKAIDILDEACASVRLHSTRDYSGETGDPVVDADTVRHIISQWTNIPLTRLNAAESSSLLQLEKALHERIVGQNTAVKAVAQAVRRARAGLKDPRRPVGSFLFLGPTGVGKTELAKALAENLFGDERALLRFDMSEYMEKHTASRLVGAPPGYVGYEEGGRLTSAVKHRPYSIVLLDEIEKAHPDIFNLLLQIMEDGRLTDGQGVTVDFRNCVILMTSNACAELMSDKHSLGFAADADTAVSNQKQNVLQGIKDIFRPEFLNRLDEIVVFDPDRMLDELRKRLQDTGMNLRMTAAARDKLLQAGMDVRYGARPLRRALQKEIEDKLADLYLERTFTAGDEILIDVMGGDFSFSRLKEAETENMIPVQEEQNYG